MQINLNQLRAFYMAVHYKSISTAAEQLYVTPAAVSMQIKKLEQWLGKRLLERSGNTFTVTEEGMALQAYAQNIFNEVERLEHNIMVRRRDQAGELRIGMHHFPAQYFMPTILMGLKKKYPNLKLIFEHGTRKQLINKLFQHKIQIALFFGDVPPDLQGIPLCTDTLILVGAPNSRHIDQDEIRLEDLANIPLILQEEGTGVLLSLFNFFERSGVKPKILMENICSDVIKQFVIIDVGLSFISNFAVRKEINSGELKEISLKNGNPDVVLSAVYEEDILSQPSVQAALDTFASINYTNLVLSHK